MSITPFIILTCIVFFVACLLGFGIVRGIAEFNTQSAKEAVAACFPSFVSIVLVLFKKVGLVPLSFISAQTFSCEDVKDGTTDQSQLI